MRVLDKTANQTGPPSVYDNRSRFPGKSIALQHVFFSRSVKSTLGRRRNIIAKEVKPGSKIGFSPAPDLQQMPRLLKAFGQTKSFCHFQQGSFSFFFGKIVLFLSFWAGFFLFLTQGLFSAFDFPLIVCVKSFHVGILSSTRCK